MASSYIFTQPEVLNWLAATVFAQSEAATVSAQRDAVATECFILQGGEAGTDTKCDAQCIF